MYNQNGVNRPLTIEQVVNILQQQENKIKSLENEINIKNSIIHKLMEKEREREKENIEKK